ncbi:MAG: polyphosphate kinase 1 [Sutterellaceae bacterium]|nr:polyphosphate kinase 1 [Sutterellaceae bacterium]
MAEVTAQEKVVKPAENAEATPQTKEKVAPKKVAVKSPRATRAAKPAAKKTVAKKAPAAEPAVDAPLALDNPSLYTNREISWIEFDRKVLETAMDPKVPLLDRVKFLSIFFNNLDEFYMVRVMNLQRQSRSGVAPTGADKMPPAKQLVEIRRRVTDMLDQAEKLWLKTLLPALEKKDIRFVAYESLPEKHRAFLDKYFETEIFPVLTPQAVDAGRPFPMISSRSINFVIELRSDDPADDKPHYARLKSPNNVPRFLFIPETFKEGEQIDLASGEGRIVLMEDLISHRMGMLFPGYSVKNFGMFRVTRNTDGEIEEDEADDLLSAVRDYVEQRRFGSIVRLELLRGMPVALQEFLIRHLDLQPAQIYKSKMPLAFSEFIRLMKIDRPGLKYPPFKSKLPKEFEPEADVFEAIREHDIMVYHPYNSFGCVLRFLREAAMDPDVVAIKQTLYRCGSDSPVVKSLLEARRRGKQVTAVVELKARFDEEQNINWAEELERQGVNVVYGFAGLKIHAKLCLVVRREKTGLRRYAHIGTGNYNASSAKIYTDLGLFTSNFDICNDVQDLFNVMTGFGVKDDYREIFVSPVHLRNNVTRLIREEVEIHRKEGNGLIILKCNQLVDPDIVRELYEASRAGVKIECVVRGICSLRPGIKGVSETITVRSIVGELLEHARIYWFNHAGDNRMYVGSADLMTRNLNGRIEVLTPVLDKAIRENIFKQIVVPQLADNTNAWELNSDGTYTRIKLKAGEKPYQSQTEIGKKLNLQKR